MNHLRNSNKPKRRIRRFRGRTEDAYRLSDEDRERLARKLRVRLYHSLMAVGQDDHARDLVCCGRWYKGRVSPCLTIDLRPLRCQSMFCLTCQRRRSEHLRRRVVRLLSRKGKSYWFLTLTLKNRGEITREWVAQIIRQFSVLRSTDVWGDVDGRENGITGGIYSIEATYNGRARTWHPHLHVIVEAPETLPKRWIFAVQAEWKRITGDSWVVHLEPCGGWRYVRRRGRAVKVPNGSPREQRRAVRETVKYVTKSVGFADSPDLVDEFLRAFRSVRRVQSFGSFLGAEDAAEKDAAEEHEPALKCRCGNCRADQWKDLGCVPESETVELPDGSRQLKLFSGAPSPGPPVEDISWWGPELVESELQCRFHFDGALPFTRTPSRELVVRELF